MSKLDLNQIHLELEHEIKRLSQSSFVIYSDALREDVHEALLELKPEIDTWFAKLSQRSISYYELETLLEKQKGRIELTRLKRTSLEESELENVKHDILRMIAKSIMNLHLNSLFRSQPTIEVNNVKKENIF